MKTFMNKETSTEEALSRQYCIDQYMELEEKRRELTRKNKRVLYYPEARKMNVKNKQDIFKQQHLFFKELQKPENRGGQQELADILGISFVGLYLRHKRYEKEHSKKEAK